MTMAIQLEFDSLGLNDKEMEIYLLKKEMSEMNRQLGNVRRGLFSRHNEMHKLIIEQKLEIDRLKFEMQKLRNSNESD